ncbi:hypothetical protein B0T17DRAFT_587686 [Bombardia bombarda]|uniref:Major facilitator superfamily transporter n=1 Tax=Bombardia bombarda TaxID=252184 RepID=A0AA39XMD2_9PEZI|nr:hypothetical protein B0T17DRAFT_587686 [Bombardia bombarda]
MDRDIDGLISDIPPKPPAKDLPRIPRPSLSMSRPGTSSSEPPNRPLPPTPMSKAIPPQPTMGLPEAPKRPAPIRPAPLKPQAPLRMNPPTRPGTATSQASGMTDQTRILGSTKRLSWGSMASSRRPIKYGQGKYMHVELVPQPSDDPDDPLNWPMWRKELNFASLLLMVAMTGVMKTMFVSVNARLAEGYDVTYTAAAALTGVPLILSSFTGFLSLVLSRICGKRPLYLVSLLLVFIGAVWNTNVANSYAECMAARIFQGLGWGAFDALVMGSIQDTFFEHQCGLRVAIYSIVAVSTTWGPPLLGGVASEGQAGFSLQFAILSAFFVLAVPAITLGAPETVFDRAYTLAQTPATGASKYKVSLPLAPRRFFSMETFYNYIVKVKPYSYRGSYDLTTLLQAPRAFVAPTTTLLSLVSLFPYCSLWGLSASLSLLFNPAPFALSTRSIGTLMTGPWLLGTGVVAAFALLRWWQTRLTPKAHMAAIAGGSLLAFIGILTFGLHIDAGMAQPDDVAIADDGGATAALSVPSAPQMFLAGANVNFPAISFMLGMLAAGTYALDATVRPLIRASTMFTSSNLGVALRNTTDMGAGVTCWRTLFAGILFIAVPNAVMASGDGLRALCIAFAIAQMVIGALVGTVWWLWGEDIRRWDGRVMRLVDLDMLKSSGSFFDTD